MQDRFWLYQRSNGIFYIQDRSTGKQESLRTKDSSKANRLLQARNQANEQPLMNLALAKAYLSAKSPEIASRTWSDVMEQYVRSGVESTRERKERAFRSAPFHVIRSLKLIETEAAQLLAVLGHAKAGNSTHHYLKRLHNYALHLGWLLAPVMAEAAWPLLRRRRFQAIMYQEHQKIVQREQNSERRLYFEMLWETGGSQTDIANLHRDRIDAEQKTLRFFRQKLAGKEDGHGGGDTFLCIGARLRGILDQLPQEGYLFPDLRLQEPKDRAGYFRKACLACGIKGRTLHSYRYAWAQRAKAAGMPLREAMNHMGHKSRAIHAAYGAGAETTTLPLEYYEQQQQGKVIEFQTGKQKSAA